MKQTRKASLIESIANIVIGFIIQYLFLIITLHSVGISITLMQNLWVGTVMTIVSLVRSYALRRLFETMRIRGILP